MAEKPFNPKDLEDMKNFLDLQEKIGENMRKGTRSFVKASMEARKVRKDIEASEKRIKSLEEERENLKEKIKTLDGKELENAKAKLSLLNEEVNEQEKLVDQNLAVEASLKRQRKSLKNISIAVGRDVLKGTKTVLGYTKQLSTEYFKQDDTLRRTAVNIGLMGKHQEQFRKTVYKSALATQRLGMDASAVAETYGSYVDNVGRLIPLTTKAAYAMSEMAMGTALGKEGAAQMAASMEVFGMSIESTAGYVEDVSNMSEKMGVNSGKVLKDLSQNLRKAQTVRFKGGVEGMAKMAAKATKIRADMGTALGFAQDLWEPEKAIETAANLQMMGGAFAKMGDPIRLMFLGRNDPATLMNELAQAAGSVVKNMGDGTYDIPTMELQKLKQVAEQTGVPFEELVEQAKTVARQGDISRILSPKIDKEGKDFISSIAEYSEKEGGFVVNVGGDVKKLSQLSQEQVKAMMTESKTLEERAKSAQSLMTLFSNFFNSFKNLASSFFAGMEKNLRGPIESLLGTGKGTLASFSDSIYETGKNFGSYIASFIEKIPGYIGSIQKIPEKIKEYYNSFINSDIWQTIKDIGNKIGSAFNWVYDVFGSGGILASVLLIKFPGILKGVIGLLTGGIKGIASIFGGSKRVPQAVYDVGGGGFGGDGGDGGDMMTSRARHRGPARVGRRGLKRSGVRLAAKMFGKKAAGGIVGKALGGLTKGFARGGPIALLGAGMDVGRMFLDNPDSGVGKALGIGSSAAMGASIGAFLGPLGTAAGGLIGGIYGAVKEFSKKTTEDLDKNKLSSNIESITRSSVGGATTSLADGAVMPDGNVIKTAKGNMYDLAPKDVVSIGQPGSNSNRSSSGGNMNISVNGSIRLEGGGVSIDLMKSPEFQREVTKIVIKGMENQNR